MSVLFLSSWSYYHFLPSYWKHILKPRIVPGHLLFSKEEGIGPLALVSVTGSIDGQRKSPFPKEQEQQPRQRKQSMKVEPKHNRNAQVQKMPTMPGPLRMSPWKRFLFGPISTCAYTAVSSKRGQTSDQLPHVSPHSMRQGEMWPTWARLLVTWTS